MKSWKDAETAIQYRGYAPAPLYSYQYAPAPYKSRKKKIVWISLVALVVIVIAVTVPVVLTTRKRGSPNAAQGGSGPSEPNSNHPTNNATTSGKTGSEIAMDDGTTFTYTNDFDGDWAYDPKQPFAPGGKAQSWSKRVGTEEWIWGTDIARGVNLGYGIINTLPSTCSSLFVPCDT